MERNVMEPSRPVILHPRTEHILMESTALYVYQEYRQIEEKRRQSVTLAYNTRQHYLRFDRSNSQVEILVVCTLKY